jgi:cytidylate kinase/pantoate ligase/cytidylate kinase
MIVTIDGPAGAGKSTVARALADRLGFRFLDTGAMYRVVALAAARRNVDWEDAAALAELAHRIEIRFDGDRVFLDGRDVTREIRSSQITAHVRPVADNPGVRQRLVDLQRRIGDEGDLVTEGRDQGTVAFPHAQCKIFLTASAEERARRRVNELLQRGETTTVQEVLAQQNMRDQQDSRRPVGALIRAADAVQVSTDGMSQEQVVERLVDLVRRRQAELGLGASPAE